MDKLPDIVSDAIGIIDEEACYLSGITELAARVGVSYEHLSREFTKAMGISIGKYLRIKKIEEARRVLVSTDMKIHMVSGLCGFEDADYFTEQFKKHVGLTPSQYRKKYRLKGNNEEGTLELVDISEEAYL